MLLKHSPSISLGNDIIADFIASLSNNAQFFLTPWLKGSFITIRSNINNNARRKMPRLPWDAVFNHRLVIKDPICFF